MPEQEDADPAPRGDLAIRTVAMPADANASGDIFGGWLLAQMDLAGGAAAARRARGRVATVAIDRMEFHRPVFIGDVLSAYVELLRVGRSSMTYRIEAWAERRAGSGPIKVTQGVFTFVAIDADRRPRLVSQERAG
ncbi:MAG: acyl-CoA thioesterase [Alphaproteobacteria bacterium]|nr:acyl-CoA thioesterase [Alphaproteobacteria bacterium]